MDLFGLSNLNIMSFSGEQSCLLVYKSVWMFRLVKCFRILWDEKCNINVKYFVIIYYCVTHSKYSWDALFVLYVVVLCALALHLATAHKDLLQKKLD